MTSAASPGLHRQQGPITVAIVDDEAPARARLASLLARHPDVRVAAVLGDARAAIATLRRPPQPIDLVFLDVALPEIDGFGIIAAVGAAMPAVIFVTAHDVHAVRAFEVQALDYLLKPFDRTRFDAVLGRARARLHAAPSAGPAPGDRLLVPLGDRIELVRTADIDWAEAAGNYVELHLGATTHLLRATLTELERRLGSEGFLRIHRDTVVNLDRVSGFHRWLGGQYRAVLRDGTTRPIGRRYRAILEARVGKL
jgi:two-component system LytT family response regulator